MTRTDLPVEKIVDLYKGGMYSYKISEMYNASNTKIRGLLKKEGIKLRNYSESQIGGLLPVKEITRKYQDKMSTVELAGEYKVSISTINRLLKKEGVKLRSISEAHLGQVLPVKEIVRKHKNGIGTYKLAYEYKVDVQTIRKLLKETGVEFKKVLPVEEIVKKHQDGKNTVELAHEYEVSTPTIKRLLKKAEVKLRNLSEAQIGKILPVEKIVKKYNDGNSTYELADEYRVSNSTIYRLLKNEGIKLRSMSEAHLHGKVFPVDEIVKRYQDGISLFKLTNEYNVSTPTIKNLLKKEGVRLRGMSEAKIGKILPVDEIVKKYNDGNSTYALADEYGVSSPTIGRLLKNARIELRSNSNLEEALRAFGEQK